MRNGGRGVQDIGCGTISSNTVAIGPSVNSDRELL